MQPSDSSVPRTIVRCSPLLLRTALFVATLILLTSSFDIFLVFNAGGNYRFCQILALLLIILAIFKSRWTPVIPILGIIPMTIWLMIQILFIPVASFWPKSLAYCLWLLVNIGFIFACVQLFSERSEALLILLRTYIYSFALIASFGILQFAMPLLGFPGLLVTQWWIPDRLARANAFSYEPSYFATFLLIGFVLIGSLRRSHSSLLSPKNMLIVYVITGTGIFVSSSRMGIVFLLIDVVLSQGTSWLSAGRNLMRCKLVPSKIKALIPSACLAIFGLAACSVLINMENRAAIALMFLNGTGISGTAAHSVDERENSLSETLAVFLDHPLIGRSLGGVSSAIADREGTVVQTFEDSKRFEGMSVFAEVLAASGIIGVIPFVWFLAATIWKPLALSRRVSPQYSSLLCGLVRSFIFAWAILEFNQNVLRPYLWVHLAILATVYAAARSNTSLTLSL